MHFKGLWRLGQIFEPFLIRFAFGANQSAKSQEDERKVEAKVPVLRVPEFEFALVGGYDGIMKPLPVPSHEVQNFFFVSKDKRTNAGESRGEWKDGGLRCLGVKRDMLGNNGPWPHEAHLTQKDIDELGKLVDFCLPQEMSHREDAGILGLSDEATRQIGTVFQHRGEFEDIETFSVFAHPRLEVEDVMFAGELQANDDGHHEGKKHHHCNQGKDEVKCS